MPSGATSSLLFAQSEGIATSDFDHGTVFYPQFHDPFWTELRTYGYEFDVTLLDPRTGLSTNVPGAATVFSWVSMTPAPTGPIAPVVGPPSAPMLNGNDAFAPQTGVGDQPEFSWSSPKLGVATSYQISIRSLGPNHGGDTVFLSATVYTGASFKVPPGFLKPDVAYYAVITAQQAPWDVLNHGPFRTGTPLHTADCVTGIFVP